jgi:hypothetical protein
MEENRNHDNIMIAITFLKLCSWWNQCVQILEIDQLFLLCVLPFKQMKFLNKNAKPLHPWV